MKVRVTMNTHQCSLKENELCELAGFCTCSDNRPFAVLCSVETGKFDFVPIYAIKKENNDSGVEK